MSLQWGRVALVAIVVSLLTACGLFNLSLSDGSVSIAPGGSATVSMTLSPVTPYGGNFTVSLVGNAPLAVAQGNFTLSVANTARTVPLTITAPVGAAPGVYVVQVQVSSDGVVRSAPLTVTVTSPVSSGELACQHAFEEGSTVIAVATNTAGDIFVSGSRVATEADPATGFIARLDGNCVPQWLKTGFGPQNLAVASDDRIIGVSTDAVVVLDPTGTELMRTPSPDPETGSTISDSFFKYAMTLDGYGHVIVGGMDWVYYENEYHGVEWHEVPAVRAYNLVDLSVAWTATFPTPTACYFMCRVNSVAVDVFGNVGVAGFTSVAYPGYTLNNGADTGTDLVMDMFAASISPTGATQWLRQFGTPAADSGGYAAFDSSRHLVVASATSGSYPGYTSLYGSDEYALHKFDIDGTLLWQRQGNTVSGVMVPRGVVVDSQDNILVGLMSFMPNETFTAIKDLAGTGLKLDDDGATLVWQRDVLPGTTWAIALDDTDHLILGGRIYEGAYPSYTSLRGVVTKYRP